MAALLAVLMLGGCAARVGHGSENTLRQKNSYEERVNPKAPHERQPETAPVVEVDLEEPKRYKSDPGDPPPKKEATPAESKGTPAAKETTPAEK